MHAARNRLEGLRSSGHLSVYINSKRRRRVKLATHVNIVVTCTKRKKVSPAAELMLRDVQAPDSSSGLKEWLERLEASGVESIPARNLYAGDHWSIVQSLEVVAANLGLDAIIWVCSAGYGLIGIDTKIKPYSATFSYPHPDTVCRWEPSELPSQRRSLWWESLQDWSGPDPTLPRSIAGLASQESDTPLLVVASKVYLGAISDDLRKAALVVSNSDQLSVISTGTTTIPGLDSNLLPSSAALSKNVGGNLRTLNVRLARMILSESSIEDFRASRLQKKFRQLVDCAEPLPKYDREAMTDESIKQYILNALTENLAASHSPLLRQLRDSGRACSQGRFSRLFDSTKAELAGQG